MADARVKPWAKFPLPAKRSKYKNVKTVVDGIEFDSKKEAKRWLELRAMERCGDISCLQRQVVFALIPPVVLDGRKRPETKYIADFKYRTAAGDDVVEDAKGFKTDSWSLKRKLMRWIHGIEVVES